MHAKQQRRWIARAGIVMALANLGALGACGSDTSPNSVIDSRAVADDQSPVPVTGTGGRLIPIDSDNVAAAGYDASTQTMYVEFKEGSLYEYGPVGPDVWQAFVNAQPNPWSEVGHPVLVEGGVPYSRIR